MSSTRQLTLLGSARTMIFASRAKPSQLWAYTILALSLSFSAPACHSFPASSFLVPLLLLLLFFLHLLLPVVAESTSACLYLSPNRGSRGTGGILGNALAGLCGIDRELKALRD